MADTDKDTPKRAATSKSAAKAGDVAWFRNKRTGVAHQVPVGSPAYNRILGLPKAAKLAPDPDYEKLDGKPKQLVAEPEDD